MTQQIEKDTRFKGYDIVLVGHTFEIGARYILVASRKSRFIRIKFRVREVVYKEMNNTEDDDLIMVYNILNIQSFFETVDWRTFIEEKKHKLYMGSFFENILLRFKEGCPQID